MNWDLLILNPLFIIILFLIYFLVIRKSSSISSTKAKLFLVQTFCFWLAFSLILQNNFRFQNIIIQLGINDIEGMAIIVMSSTLLYSLIAMLPLHFFLKYNRRELYFKIFHYAIFGSAIIGMLTLLIFQNVATLIIAAIFLGFAIVVRTNYILKYNDLYNKKFFPFKTIGIISSLLIFAGLVGYEVNNIIVVQNNGQINYTNIRIVIAIALILVIIAFLLFIFFDTFDYYSEPYTDNQKKILEPFNWKKITLIFILTFFVVAIKEVSHSYIYLWLLGQRTWEQYHSVQLVNLFLRVNQEMFLLPQFLSILLISKWLYNRVGIKYLFAGGLLSWFFFFTIGAFNHSAVVFLVLQIINGLAFGICFSILLGITCEWKNRAPAHQPVMLQFQFIWFAVQFICSIIDNSLFINKVGIYENFTNTGSWYIDKLFASQIDDITTIIFAVCAIIILVLLVIFYYLSDYILAEYANHLVLLVPKLNIILRDDFLNKIKSEL